MLGFLLTEPPREEGTTDDMEPPTMNSILSPMTFFTSQPWTIPLIGLLVASLAFLFGRRWLVARSAPKTVQSAEEVSPFLTTANLKKKSEQDRRTAPRRRGNRVEVYLTNEAKTEQVLAWVVNRSMGGVCLVVEQPLEEGTLLKVRPRGAPQTAPWLAVEIRSCRANGNDWEIGCRFLEAPQWNDLLLFG
jgi:hypothetical protein